MFWFRKKIYETIFSFERGRTMTDLFKDPKGMTYVEIMVAIVLVTVVVVPVVALVTNSATLGRRVDMVYTASSLAQRRIDLVKRFDFDEIDKTEETDVRVGADGMSSEAGEYIRTTSVFTTENPYLLRVKTSVDRVVDDEASGNPVVMETLFVDSEEDMIYVHGD